MGGDLGFMDMDLGMDMDIQHEPGHAAWKWT
jgi:hypothetical protein